MTHKPDSPPDMRGRADIPDTRLNEIDRDEWFEIAKLLRPDVTDDRGDDTREDGR